MNVTYTRGLVGCNHLDVEAEQTAVSETEQDYSVADDGN
jgi:hypothetical protein